MLQGTHTAFSGAKNVKKDEANFQKVEGGKNKFQTEIKAPNLN